MECPKMFNTSAIIKLEPGSAKGTLKISLLKSRVYYFKPFFMQVHCLTAGIPVLSMKKVLLKMLDFSITGWASAIDSPIGSYRIDDQIFSTLFGEPTK